MLRYDELMVVERISFGGTGRDNIGFNDMTEKELKT